LVIKNTQYTIHNTQYLKNKRILITAGPTWVAIDSVRVISNIATGETGILLAEKLQRLGAKVTLLLGPVGSCCLNKKIKLIHFRFFDELKDNLIKELKSKKYDVVIHSAAVSDYKPLKIYARKVKSGIKNWQLHLVPTEKIVGLTKKIDRTLFLVGFKFEPGVRKKILIDKTRSLVSHAGLDLAVANTIDRNRYLAYIVEREKIYGPILNKKAMVEKLVNITGEKIWKN